jgi:hypothetical protein
MTNDVCMPLACACQVGLLSSVVAAQLWRRRSEALGCTRTIRLHAYGCMPFARLQMGPFLVCCAVQPGLGVLRGWRNIPQDAVIRRPKRVLHMKHICVIGTRSRHQPLVSPAVVSSGQ